MTTGPITLESRWQGTGETNMITGQSASIEFTAGRILWTVDGVPIDARKPAVMGECCVLGCDKPTHADSAFCSERHGGAEPPPER